MSAGLEPLDYGIQVERQSVRCRTRDRSGVCIRDAQMLARDRC